MIDNSIASKIFDISIILNSLNISLIYTIKIGIIVLSSMFILNYIINTGIMKKFLELMKPLNNLKINPLSLYSISICFFSPTVGYSILAEGLKDEKLTKKEIIGSSLANSFPSVLSHTITFFVPVVIPILGLTGVFYILIRLGVAFIKSIIGLVYLRLVSQNVDFDIPKTDKLNKKENINKSFNSTLKFSKKLIPIMFITMFLVMYLSKIGFFDLITIFISPLTDQLELNPNVGLVALTETVNVQSAIIMAGGFLKESILTTKEVLIGLVIGNVITLSSKYAKHSLPLHVSLFGAKFGTKIVMINAMITLLIDILIIIGIMIYP
ncbi:hypothetical protein [Methanococcus aeolicus]|uniref:hypothetical protein n=1 Tax=Methanococcus aeolicus TaxID=42879 RepID=UPI0021C5DC80|nr:hypothetical protein [Methanococcus aeolicus]UXM85194.1 hypothetical protein N6C89_02640 [Methanococcus aeolicus]